MNENKGHVPNPPYKRLTPWWAKGWRKTGWKVDSINLYSIMTFKCNKQCRLTIEPFDELGNNEICLRFDLGRFSMLLQKTTLDKANELRLTAEEFAKAFNKVTQ